MPASALFRDFSLNKLRLKNRLVMAPMSRYQCPDNIAHQGMAEYYARRAKGGVGLVISEGTYIGHPSADSYAAVPHFHGPSLQEWAGVLKKVHKNGAAMFPQLWHSGDFRELGNGPDPSVPGFSPSGVLNTYNKNTKPPKTMTDADIAEVITAYADAARAAESLGFDGVEIHGAHGYLIDEFFWSVTNRRKDRYGGTLENRVRFACEVVRAMRSAISPDFPICFRYSQWKQQDFDARIATTPKQLEFLLGSLVDSGVDMFHASNRRFWLAEFEGSDMSFAGWTRKLSGKPTITVGSVGLSSTSYTTAEVSTLDSLYERMGAGEFDLVALGRALLADPEWANKVKNDQMDQITPYNGTHIQNYY